MTEIPIKKAKDLANSGISMITEAFDLIGSTIDREEVKQNFSATPVTESNATGNAELAKREEYVMKEITDCRFCRCALCYTCNLGSRFELIDEIRAYGQFMYDCGKEAAK